MTDLPRDPAVEKTVRSIRVPDHGADFWKDLEARLDEEDGTATVVPLRRRMSNRLPLVAAAALVLVVAVAALAQRSEDTQPINTTDEPQQPISTEPTDSPSTTETPTTAKAGSRTAMRGRPTPDGAVDDWLTALRAGQFDTASELVGPRSRQYIESLGGNLRGFMVESQEGYGGWAEDRSTTEIDLGTVNGTQATIVVVTGTWDGEGDTPHRTDALPTVRTASGWVVEPMAFRSDSGGRLELVEPAAATFRDKPQMSPDGTIKVAAPGAGSFYFSLEDSAPVRVAGTRSGGGTTATWDPPGTLPRQSVLVVVAYADGDTLTALARVIAVTD